mmetsp:Transcript_55157/g.144819  ORF Transcript_55157/g.144819 Transcript_55157/m.144819 type:complete len:579 (+) Transcript_55157:80-1816(+)
MHYLSLVFWAFIVNRKYYAWEEKQRQSEDDGSPPPTIIKGSAVRKVTSMVQLELRRVVSAGRAEIVAARELGGQIVGAAGLTGAHTSTIAPAVRAAQVLPHPTPPPSPPEGTDTDAALAEPILAPVDRPAGPPKKKPRFTALPQTLVFPNVEVLTIALFTSGIIECAAAIIGAHAGGGIEIEAWELIMAWISMVGTFGFYIQQTYALLHFYRHHAKDLWVPVDEPASVGEIEDPIYAVVGGARDCLRLKRLKLRTRELGEFVPPDEDEEEPGKTERALWRAFTCGFDQWIIGKRRTRVGDQMVMLTLWMSDSSGWGRPGVLYLLVQTWLQLFISLWVGLLFAHPFAPTSPGVRTQLYVITALLFLAFVWTIGGTANDKLEGYNTGLVYGLECFVSMLMLASNILAERAGDNQEDLEFALSLAEICVQVLLLSIFVPIALTVYDAAIVPLARIMRKQGGCDRDTLVRLAFMCILVPLEIARSYCGMCNTSFADLAAEMEDLGSELIATVADDAAAPEGEEGEDGEDGEDGEVGAEGEEGAEGTAGAEGVEGVEGAEGAERAAGVGEGAEGAERRLVAAG